MRIALRTGGGRGVYELAGSQSLYSASDLFDKTMFYEFTPELVIPGRAVPSTRQGKPRIKLDEQQRTTHLYRLLAGLLLLPKPKREFKTTSGNILIAFEAYSMTAIKIDISVIQAKEVVVRPTEILLENYQGLRKSINFVDRMTRIIQLWGAAYNQESDLADLLRNHQTKLNEQEVNHKEIEKAAKRIFEYLETAYDPLSALEEVFGIEAAGELEVPLSVPSTQDFGAEDSMPPSLARIENVRRWKKVAARGSVATQFRAKIKDIYKDTCLFSGQRLPKLDSISSSGVDAAHILPWASHGINSIDNGICLSKQYHWAFDSGVIKLAFDSSSDHYQITIPETVVIEAQQKNFSLENFQAIVGPIPPNRLPKNPEFCPNPEYLYAFNEIMFA